MNQEPSPQPYVRTILRTSEFDAYYASLNQKVQTKFDYVMNVVASVRNISTKFIRHLEKTDLYEMRVSVGTNEYRTVLFAVDHDNVIESKTILLLNGFLKKDNRDYRKQIEIAQAILKQFEL